MTREVIATCPVCEGELQVSRLRCTTCGTAIEGQFSVGRFGRLSREQMYLLESFLRARGNLRDMERELGISYPTVRNRVEALVRALGLADDAAPSPAPAEATASQRRDVLERLARHEITAEQAAAELRGEPAEVASPAEPADPAEPAEPPEPPEPKEPKEPEEPGNE